MGFILDEVDDIPDGSSWRAFSKDFTAPGSSSDNIKKKNNDNAIIIQQSTSRRRKRNDNSMIDLHTQKR